MRISDWSSDVCSSDLLRGRAPLELGINAGRALLHMPVDHDATAAIAGVPSVIRLRSHAPNFVESDAHAVTPDDDCYYLFEYVSHKGPGFSRTNALIADLKIKPGDAAKDGENRKGQAIDRCAAVLRSALAPSWVRGTTFVPIPSPKTPQERKSFVEGKGGAVRVDPGSRRHNKKK